MAGHSRLAKTGQLPGATRIGKDWRVSVTRLEAHLHSEQAAS